MTFKVRLKEALQKRREQLLMEEKAGKRKYTFPEYYERAVYGLEPLETGKGLRYLAGLKKRERQIGSLIEFGKGEMDFGVITRLDPKGVWVQPLQSSEEFGLEPRGKEIFIEQERFEKHLGEEGAVSPKIFLEF